MRWVIYRCGQVSDTCISALMIAAASWGECSGREEGAARAAADACPPGQPGGHGGAHVAQCRVIDGERALQARTPHHDRRKGGLGKRGYRAAKDLDGEFQTVCDAFKKRGQRRPSAKRLHEMTLARLPADDPRRKRCTVHAARVWLKKGKSRT
jgi:hypothetical protein